MKRKYPILGEVRDVEGSLWYVRDVRTTKHGFDLLWGSPVTRLRNYSGGLPRLIATQPLVDYWEANCTRHDGVLFDLPAGRTTLKRLRSRLRFNYHLDVAEFWKERIEDLDKLSAREFARRHNVELIAVFENRRKLLGRRARMMNWWQTPQPLEILRSSITLREMGEKLSISISQAHRLRRRACKQA